MKNNDTLIFIPDISGFTKFVHETEIDHSSHIISELLEKIIHSNTIGLKVSEIEGDAVLFYKQDNLPKLQELILQAEKMFLAFHEHLIRYENERICRCGACRTAANLSLKFVSHTGEVNIIQIGKHQKLHGSDVIIAHRLLKNSIDYPEYVLLTDSYKQQIENFQNSAYQIVQGTKILKTEKDIHFYYFDLGNLLESIPQAEKLVFEKSGKIVFSKEVIINKSIDEVYFNIQDFGKRMQWNPSIKKMTMQNENINKSGVIHQCLVGNDVLNIKTLGRKEFDDRIEFAERTDNIKIFKEITTTYKLQKSGNQTKIILESDFVLKPYVNFLSPLIRVAIKSKTQKIVKQLKSFSENH